MESRREVSSRRAVSLEALRIAGLLLDYQRLCCSLQQRCWQVSARCGATTHSHVDAHAVLPFEMSGCRTSTRHNHMKVLGCSSGTLAYYFRVKPSTFSVEVWEVAIRWKGNNLQADAGRSDPCFIGNEYNEGFDMNLAPPHVGCHWCLH